LPESFHIPRVGIATTVSSVYDFNPNGIDGDAAPLSVFRGKVLLVANAASGSGFTRRYVGLEALYQQIRRAGVRSYLPRVRKDLR
jgi:glutathione peroxidase